MEQIKPIPNADRRYTYEDYLAWTDDTRWELIDGIPYAMAPAPSERHQSAAGELYRALGNFLEGKPCRAYMSPIDVRLDAKKGRKKAERNVVQPDVLVVCDTDKIDESGILGAPDIVVEVLSKGSARYDYIIKRELYERAGVREYWIVDPEGRGVSRLVLEGGRYSAAPEADKLTTPILEGFELELKTIFGPEAEPPEARPAPTA